MENQDSSNKNKWYKGNGGIIALLIFFFPVGLFLMWKYAHWNKAVKWVITAIFAIFVFASINSSNSTTNQTQTSSNSSTTSTSQPTATPQPKKPLTTEDKLWQAYKNFDNQDTDFSGVKIDYDATTNTTTLTNTSDNFLDEQSAVNGVVNSLVGYGMQAFKIPGVDKLVVAFRSTFTDSYGHKSTDDIARIGMTKDEFAKYDWKNLEFQPIYDQLQSSADPFYVNPSILGKIDTQKINLSLP
ncbi:MAG TPA: hypothetical protein VMR41_02485 [Patescibacteria group bacterium]|nr:hypothetical protein [Patescibacteria group bacterium]